MTLRDYVRQCGLTMAEFRDLDPETQELWRKKQQELNRQEQISSARQLRQILLELSQISSKNER